MELVANCDQLSENASQAYVSQTDIEHLILFSEAEMLDMSLMPSDVYYPSTNLGCLATILNTITVQTFLKRLKEIMQNEVLLVSGSVSTTTNIYGTI